MYQVRFSEHAVKELKKLDKQTARVIKNWVVKNLVDTTDPRQHGKSLTGNLEIKRIPGREITGRLPKLQMMC